MTKKIVAKVLLFCNKHTTVPRRKGRAAVAGLHASLHKDSIAPHFSGFLGHF